jgi:1-acyl-sn-glycerol-3-phosphate acyltransferase
MRYICSIIFKLWGWKTVGKPPMDKKAVIIAVPHTSAWDFIIGKLAFASMGIPISILIKKEFFRFPLGPILRGLGAISVDRGNRKSTLIQQLVNEFDSRDRMYLSITPEGTRGKRDKWKRGFYEIAMAADVPVYFGIIDYGKKECEVGERFIPTGDFAKDIEYIQTSYKNVTARHPECFSWGERFYGDKK